MVTYNKPENLNPTAEQWDKVRQVFSLPQVYLTPPELAIPTSIKFSEARTPNR